MKTRQFILEQAGHTVFSVSSSQELETICSKHNFEVAVIGQNTPARLKREHMALIRRLCPAIKVLELYPPYVGKILDHADAWLEMPPERPEIKPARLCGVRRQLQPLEFEAAIQFPILRQLERRQA